MPPASLLTLPSLPRPPRAWRLWAVLLWALLMLPWARAAAPLALDDAQPRVTAWPAVTVLSEQGTAWTPAEALARLPEFAAPQAAHATLGVRTEAMWLHLPLTVAPTSDGQWTLDIDYAVLNRIDAVLMQDGRVVAQAVMGNLQPLALRPLPSRSHAWALALEPGARYDLLLRVATRGAMIVPLTLNKPSAFLTHALQEQLLQGVLTGLALCLLVYSLGQCWLLREPLFAQYALLISGSLLFSLQLFGVGSQYLWRGNLWMELHASGLSALMATCGSFLFIGQTLAGHRPRSRLLWSMRGGALLAAVLGLAYAADLLDTRVVTAVMSLLGVVPAAMGLPGAIARMRRGDPVGGTLLLAWGVYIASTAVVIGVIQGRVPVNFWTLHSFQFGATLDMLLFMRVLGLRTLSMRADAMSVRREHDLLHTLAHSDPLTGLPNRRGLDIALSSALARATQHEQLAVFLIDLDGFKPVNDRFGHAVGDMLLVAVTTRLKAHLRQGDTVARLGGDEFVVLLSGLRTSGEAMSVMKRCMEAVRQPIALDGGVMVQVGSSIGISISTAGSSSANLMQSADEAMYSAKHAGKGRIVQHSDLSQDSKA